MEPDVFFKNLKEEYEDPKELEKHYQKITNSLRKKLMKCFQYFNTTHLGALTTEELCKVLPKMELHAHLNGSLSETTLKTLGVSKDVIKEYHINNITTENTKEKLNECFKLFKIAHAATATTNAVYTATKYVIQEFFRDNVFYLELRTTPREEQDMTKREYIEAVIQAIQDNDDPIIVNLILSIDRTHKPNISEAALDLIIEMHKLHPDVIKGVDLCGNPNLGSFDENLFTRARENGLKVTLHCAEVKNDEEILRILKFKPDRIGHAICIHPEYDGSEEIWKLFCDLQIPVECCMTSNVMSGSSQNYKTHHVTEWIKHKFPFALCTDDKGVFNTTLSKEYVHGIQDVNIPKLLLVKLVLDALHAAFVTSSEEWLLEAIFYNWVKRNIHLLRE